METLMSWEGLVVKVNGELLLLIPLDGGGSELVECSRGISEVQGEFLKVVIPEWLAGMLRIERAIWSLWAMPTASFTLRRAARSWCTDRLGQNKKATSF